jgi:hypothetical protein
MNKNQAAWLIVRSSGFICTVLGVLKIVEVLVTYGAISVMFDPPIRPPSSSLAQLIALVPGVLALVVGIYLLNRGRFIVNLISREE